MKVIKVISSLDFGGIEKVFEIAALYYEGNREDLVFLCLGKGGTSEKAIRALGYRVEVWEAVTRIPRLGLLRRMVTFFRSEKPDVVHTTGAEANFHGIIAARIAGVPVRVAEEIGMPDHSPVARWCFRAVYRQASRVIAVAGLVRDFLLHSGEAKTSRIEVIYNPVDARVFEAAVKKAEEGVFRIVSVCRLDPIKNLDLLLKGFADLCDQAPEKRLELWLVGDGPSRAHLEVLAQELSLGEKVRFWGYQQNPAHFLESASLFVLPSFSEGLPVSAAEAMLTRTPCAVTRVGGGPEFIRDGVNGWLLDPHNQAAFNQLLLNVAGMSAEERRRIGEEGRETVMEKFRPEKYLNLLDSLYKRCK